MDLRAGFMALAWLFGCWAAGAAAAEPTACPASIEVTPQVAIKAPAGWRALPMPERHWLSAARLFEGDPDDRADLVPDRDGWHLEAGNPGPYTLVCQYEGTEMTLAAAVPAGAKLCRVTQRRAEGQGVRFGKPVTGPMTVDVTCR